MKFLERFMLVVVFWFWVFFILYFVVWSGLR